MAKRFSLRDKALQSRHAVDLLSDKWRIAVIHILRDGPLRTGQIQRAITQISPKMLTQTLRGMERDGLVGRQILNTSPPRVEYRLTQMGCSLIQPLITLCLWAKAHVAERDQARTRFDLAARAPKPTRR